jgi:diaminohydroxyphosphoribosylaminopyrimidine deaminase / 5-amino-6-(5-phosphoribosylamino)uracil reductase
MSEHKSFIDEALELAVRGRGWVSPNPMVGALVVKNGKVIGRGWHKQFGGPHAEVFALNEAGELARGATLYCTLEPCNHTGKTPPCVQAVLKAGIAQVVLGARDPNLVAAGGVEALRAAGVNVVEGVREKECRRLNAAFFKHTATGLPLVTLKWAMTLDGKIATASGDSKWITGEAARERSHRLRAEHDAVLIGIGTLLADDSKLNCRCAPADSCAIRQPIRIILDSTGRIPLGAAIWAAGGGKVMIVCSPETPNERLEALRAKGADIIQFALKNGDLPLDALLTELGRRGIQSVLVEGGSRVLGSFVDSRLADKVCAFVAPRILGGQKSLSAISGRGAEVIAQSLEVKASTTELMGSDVLITGPLSRWCE